MTRVFLERDVSVVLAGVFKLDRSSRRKSFIQLSHVLRQEMMRNK